MRRLSHVMLVVYMVLALLPVAALTTASALTETARGRTRVTNQLDDLADVHTGEIEEWVNTAKGSLSQSLNDPLVLLVMLQVVSGESRTDMDYLNARDDFSEHAQVVIESGGVFDQLILTGPDGTVRGSSNAGLLLLDIDMSTEPWFEEALQTPLHDVALVGPLRDPVDGQESLYFAVAVRVMNTTEGVLCGRTSLASLHNILASPQPPGDSGEYYLVREGQQYVVAPRQAPDATVATGEIVPTALSGEQGTGTWLDYRGVPVIGVYRWIEPLNMALVAKQDVREALSDSRALVRNNVLVSALIGLAVLGVGLVVSRRILAPLRALGSTATRIADGDLELQIPESRTFEVGQLADSLNRMTVRLKTLSKTQDETIRARTRQLEITSQIGRAIAGETNLDRLLQSTVDMIRDQLGHYHAQVFLLDDLRQYAVLRTSTGKAGQLLLDRGHKLAVGSQSVVGQAASRGEPVLASDTRYADFWMPNPLLPKTRAELAVPVSFGDQVVGAIDVQDTEPDTFDEPTIAALQTIADQLAVALRNAQLFEEKESLLSASLQLTQTLTQDSWNDYTTQQTQSDRAVGFQYDLKDVRPFDAPPDDGGDGQGLSMPIALRGTIIGDLMAELPENQELSDEQRQLVGQVLERVALALENARLFEQTQLSLSETNRLYRASQSVAAADTVQELVDSVIALAISDRVDRMTFFLLDDPDEPPGNRWVEALGKWLRDPDDPMSEIPTRLQTGRPPLEAIESVPADGLVINDFDTADLDAEARVGLEQLGARSVAIFPLIVGRRTIGWVSIHNTRQKQAFGEADIRFYRTVADQSATALEGLRLFEQTQVRARRLQATNDVSRAASSILNPDILLPLIVDRVSEAFDYYHVQIFLIDELGEWAVLRASTGEVGQELLRRRHKLAVGSQSVLGQVTDHGEPVIARDTDTDPIHRRNELLPNTRAEMAIPLKTGDRVIGALDVQSTQVNAFDPEAQVILQSLADEVSVTLENAQLFQEIQDRVAELTTVNLVSQAVSRAQTLDDLYDVVAVQMMRTFGAQYGFLGVVHGNALELPIFLEGGERQPSPPPQSITTGLASHVIRTKQVLTLNENLKEEAERLGARIIGTLPKSLLAVPMLLGDEAIGAISIQDADQEGTYTDAHVRQLTTLAAYIAVKIRNAELLEEAQRRAGELGFLFNVTRAAVATSDLDESLTNVVGILCDEIAHAETSIIYLTDATGEYLEPHAAVGYDEDIADRENRVAWGEGLVGIVAARGTPLIVGDARDESVGPDGDGRPPAAVLVPLRSGEAVIGVLTIESTRPDAFGQGELRLLETASGTLTAIIQNARLLEEITQAHEQLQELDKLKTQFLANMSHELRTPLNSIIGFSRVMLKGIDGELNDLQSQDLTTIYQSGQHLLGLINDILDLSKIQAKMMEIQPEYLSLEETIDGVMASGRGLVKDRPITLYKEVEADLPEVYGDPIRLRQVLLNLVSNATKFTREGSITIRAARRDHDPQTGEPPRVQIDVVDTGIGIPEDKLDAIFEAFQQVDGSTTRQYGGTGLGLPISRNFIELHGGRMWVESTEGVGSTFSFTVPLHQPEQAKAEQVDMSDLDGDRPVVLTIDDEPGVLDLYGRYLKKEGYIVVGLNSADNLLEHVREVQPDAIVLDLNLPGKNGWDALDELRQAEDTCDIPIIICSIDDDRQRAEQAGVANYLIKPIIEDDLIGALKQVTDGSRLPERDETKEILIIDGDQEYVQTLTEVLTGTGQYDVRAMSAGYEGLQAIQEHAPDAVILDLVLPDMDGYGLLVAMRSHDSTRSIPALILAGREMSEDERDRLDWHSISYLKKDDCQEHELLNGLAALLGHA